LNPVERIWLPLKNQIAANRLYGSMKVLLETVDAFFNLRDWRSFDSAALRSG
jgi:hypothetical protein